MQSRISRMNSYDQLRHANQDLQPDTNLIRLPNPCQKIFTFCDYSEFKIQHFSTFGLNQNYHEKLLLQVVFLISKNRKLNDQDRKWNYPLPGLRSKHFFYKLSLIFSKEFKIDCQNGNWKQKEMELFLQHPSGRSKNMFYKMFPLFTKEFKIETKNVIINTGNGFMSPTSKPLIKKVL